MDNEWYKNWFDTPYYHILYKNRDENEASRFIDHLVCFLNPLPTTRFLDVACGKGRHSIYLNSKGYDVTGIDISPHSIEEARQHENATLSFFVGDMRQPFADHEFDIALNLFTSFGYFENKKDNLLALENIYAALKPGGRFVLDYFNAEKILPCIVPHEIKVIDGIEFDIRKKITAERIEKTISFTEGGRHYNFTEKVEARNKTDFERLFAKTPFIVQHIFGDYNLNPFDGKTSDRLIFVVQKPE